MKLIRSSVLQRNGAERFLEEARATASFNHPHIVTLYAVGEHLRRPYLALEYIDGAPRASRAPDAKRERRAYAFAIDGPRGLRILRGEPHHRE